MNILCTRLYFIGDGRVGIIIVAVAGDGTQMTDAKRPRTVVRSVKLNELGARYC